jgi:hypothetical protein
MLADLQQRSLPQQTSSLKQHFCAAPLPHWLVFVIVMVVFVCLFGLSMLANCVLWHPIYLQNQHTHTHTHTQTHQLVLVALRQPLERPAVAAVVLEAARPARAAEGPLDDVVAHLFGRAAAAKRGADAAAFF